MIEKALHMHLKDCDCDHCAKLLIISINEDEYRTLQNKSWANWDMWIAMLWLFGVLAATAHIGDFFFDGSVLSLALVVFVILGFLILSVGGLILIYQFPPIRWIRDRIDKSTETRRKYLEMEISRLRNELCAN